MGMRCEYILTIEIQIKILQWLTGVPNVSASLHSSQGVVKAMLVSHKPLKNFPHGEGKETMGSLISKLVNEPLRPFLAYKTTPNV
jgi:hypothetical protein